MAEIIFDEKKHQYTVDGVVYPSVTDILEHLTAPGYGKVNPAILEEAKQRGTAVHELTEAIDYGMPPEEIEDGLAGYALAYLRFLADYDVEWELIEHRFYEPKMGFCGTIDRVGKIDGVDCVLDIKTTSSPSTEQKIAVCCQTAAYAYGIWGWTEEHGVQTMDECTKRYALYLHSNGKYEFMNCSDYEWSKCFNGFSLFKELCKLHKDIASIKKTRARRKKEEN